MNYGVVIAVVIYELVVILGCAVWLKIKEKKQAAAPTDEDFALGGRNMGVIVLAPTIALTVLGSAHIPAYLKCLTIWAPSPSGSVWPM